jgi:hypothetical protein
MIRHFEIPGKFSIDLHAVDLATYDRDAEVIYVTWKDAKRAISTIEATQEDFTKLQAALVTR